MTETPPVDALAIMATEQESQRQRLLAAAEKIGLSPDQMAKLAAEYDRTAAEPVELCGYNQKGSGVQCTREPHLDEPGNRTPHAAIVGGAEVTWAGPLTYAEQLEAERGAAVICLDKHPVAKVRCERAEHGQDREHLGYDRDRVLHSWR